jgi:hypothetical protein
MQFWSGHFGALHEVPWFEFSDPDAGQTFRVRCDQPHWSAFQNSIWRFIVSAEREWSRGHMPACMRASGRGRRPARGCRGSGSAYI